MDTLHETRPLLDYMPPRGIAKELWNATLFHVQEKKLTSIIGLSITAALFLYAACIIIWERSAFPASAVYAADIIGFIVTIIFLSITSPQEAPSRPKPFSQDIDFLQAAGLIFSGCLLLIGASASVELINSRSEIYIMPKQLGFSYLTLLFVMIITACVAYPREAENKEIPA